MRERKAVLYRMVLPDFVCPEGIRARQMLEHAGFTVEEHILSTRMEADAFAAELGLDSTPQVFINGNRIGGCEELARFLEVEEAA